MRTDNVSRRQAWSNLNFHILLDQTRLAVMTLRTEVAFNHGRFADVKFGLSNALYTNKTLVRIGDILQLLD